MSRATFFLAILTAVAATLAFAVPAPAPQTTTGPQPPVPPRSDEFTVAFSIPFDGLKDFLSATAVVNGSTPAGSAPCRVLVGRDMSSHPGTPAYLNGTVPNAALVFDLTGGEAGGAELYGATVPDVRSAWGVEAPVTALLGNQDAQWGLFNYTLYHRLQSGYQNFFACRDVVNGETEWVLNFGVYQDNGENGAQPPVGCTYTTVKQNFNVQGGAVGPTV